MLDRHGWRIGIILLATLVLTGCAALAAPGSVRIEKSLTLEPGGRFELDADGGGIVLTGTSSPGARIKVYSTREDLEEHFEFRFHESGGIVRVEAERIRKGILGWFGSVKSVNLRFEVEVPRETDVLLDTAGGSIRLSGILGDTHMDTSGGSIQAEDVEGSLLADTSGGSISVSRIRGAADLDTSGGSISALSVDGDVRADTSGGSIKIEDVTGDIDADTSGGSISIGDAGGKVRADTSGGNIRVSFLSGNGAGGSLSTSGGGVRVRIDPGIGLDIDADTSGGKVATDLPVTVQGTMGKSSLRGTLNGGGAQLKIRASGGGIEIESR